MSDIPAELQERALRAYGAALAVADPIRLRFWDDRGLTMTQLRLMFILLWEQDGASVSFLAERMKVTPSTVTGLTDRLVKHRLVRREEDSEDRRVCRVYLTSQGQQVLGEIDVASRAYMQDIFGKLGKEKVIQLIDLFEEFASAAEAVQSGEIPA
jgi:DNA-binding MarR family transcriptional regulator